MDVIANHWQALRAVWPKIGPYVVIEMALPGGTLLAVLLFLYRRLRTGTMKPGHNKKAGVTNPFGNKRTLLQFVHRAAAYGAFITNRPVRQWPYWTVQSDGQGEEG